MKKQHYFKLIQGLNFIIEAYGVDVGIGAINFEIHVCLDTSEEKLNLETIKWLKDNGWDKLIDEENEIYNWVYNC